MSTTTPPPADQPEPTPSGKSGSPKAPKASSGKSVTSAASATAPPMINPAWAAYVIKEHDVIGKTAELAIATLTSAIEKQVTKVTKPEKLDKLVLAAIDESYRKARNTRGA